MIKQKQIWTKKILMRLTNTLHSQVEYIKYKYLLIAQKQFLPELQLISMFQKMLDEKDNG